MRGANYNLLRWDGPEAILSQLKLSEVHPLDPVAFPRCQKCKSGDLVPLSDFGSQGAAIHYKAWVCTNPGCGFNLKIRNGEIHVNEQIIDGNGR